MRTIRNKGRKKRGALAEFTTEEEALLVDLYDRCQGITVDSLPHTDEEEMMHLAFVAKSGKVIRRRDFFQAVLALRKEGGRLSRKCVA